MRLVASLAAVWCLAVLHVEHASAQLARDASRDASHDRAARTLVTTRLELGATRINDGSPASFQGLLVDVQGHVDRFVLGARGSVYRLAHVHGTEAGPGDVELAAAVALFGRRRVAVAAGFGLGLPAGDVLRGLGMGHTMLVPGVVAVVNAGPVRLDLSGTYHHALGADDHVLLGLHGPVVNPVTARELQLSARAIYSLAPSLAGAATAWAAFPRTDEPTRSSVGVGLVWRRGAFDIDAIIERGLADHGIRSRGSISLRFAPGA